MKVLMVCLGNICRSPLAEGLLRKQLEDLDCNDIEVDSAGTSSYHIGQAPDHRTILNARRHGIDLSTLKARQFTAQDFAHFDRIFVMDESNYRNVSALAKGKEDLDKVDYLLNCLEEGCDAAVPDPFFGGEEGFEDVYVLLEKATARLAITLKGSLHDHRS